MATNKRKAAVRAEQSITKMSKSTTRARNLTEKMASKAANAVLSTTELLEMILVDVDTKTLLLGQRVNRKWQAVISENKQLQQKLFMRRATRSEAIALGMVQPPAGLLKVESMDIDQIDGASEVALYATTEDILLINPLSTYDCDDMFFGARLATCSHARQGQSYQSESWQRMYATMPPPPRIDIRASLKKGPGHSFGTGVNYTMNGAATLGQIMAWVEAILARDGLPALVAGRSDIGLPIGWRQRYRRMSNRRRLAA
ncbi:hypothetical protein LTR56_011258 [Elasticomyces elasticus]|nr:hypothetical protein LTR56_011258 [Elasticomyces elasticus]KAK3668332.1 hypothetical protein LTR22_000623 [Elasticomyces elasticus]KAK4911009.1 hypothetical protein LTR49_020370 [Elasticomyces elasticus]KAK5756483.1 hypothetical protein LTS12_013437 [Elasticomyces elasticus]